MKRALILIIFVIALFLTVCAKKPEAKRLVGADKDIHGCIGSAGYLWCTKENLCVRPWELAKDKNIENNEESLNKYCNSLSK